MSVTYRCTTVILTLIVPTLMDLIPALVITATLEMDMTAEVCVTALVINEKPKEDDNKIIFELLQSR